LDAVRRHARFRRDVRSREHFSPPRSIRSCLPDYAFERKVLLATPTNLIAIARTVAAVA
jgi:hypothetical protein